MKLIANFLKTSTRISSILAAAAAIATMTRLLRLLEESLMSIHTTPSSLLSVLPRHLHRLEQQLQQHLLGMGMR